MEWRDRDLLGRLIDILRPALTRFILTAFKARYGDGYEEEIVKTISYPYLSKDDETIPVDLDTYTLLRLIRRNWDDVFAHAIPEECRYSFRSYISILEEARHVSAHQRPCDSDDVRYYLQTANRMMACIPDETEIGEQITQMEQYLLEQIYASKASQEAISQFVERETEPAAARDAQEEEAEEEAAQLDEEMTTDEEYAAREQALQNLLERELELLERVTQLVSHYKEDDEKLELPEVTVTPGPYAGTLCVTDGKHKIVRGWRKFQLVSEYEEVIRRFVVSGMAPDEMLITWYDNPTLCLPDAYNRRISFGKEKAKMLLAAMPQIREWLRGHRR